MEVFSEWIKGNIEQQGIEIRDLQLIQRRMEELFAAHEARALAATKSILKDPHVGPYITPQAAEELVAEFDEVWTELTTRALPGESRAAVQTPCKKV